MAVQNISFGKKIPIFQCLVRDIEHNKPAIATFLEYDCTNYSDIKELLSQCRTWKYGRTIASDMYFKLLDKYDEEAENSPNKFYVIEDEEKHIIGICETEDSAHNVNIAFLESSPDKKYKYTGQNMIASVGKILTERKGHNMYVMNPFIGAVPFYTKKCNFEPLVKNREWGSLFMQSGKIPSFIKEVETKTGGKIIDIKG